MKRNSSPLYKFGNKVAKTKVPVPLHNDTIKEFFIPAKNGEQLQKNGSRTPVNVVAENDPNSIRVSKDETLKLSMSPLNNLGKTRAFTHD